MPQRRRQLRRRRAIQRLERLPSLGEERQPGVRRDALGATIAETAGAMRGRPGAMTPDEVAAWVDELRAEETE